MWCPNCGNQILDTATFCMHCGTDLRPYKTGGSAPTPPTPPADPIPVEPVTIPSTPSYSGGDLSANPTVDRPTDSKAMRRARSFMRYLESEGYKYTYLHKKEGDHQEADVKVGFGGGSFSFSGLNFFVDFDFNETGEGDSVHITVYDIEKFPTNQRQAALELINRVANQKRFLRLYLMDDGELRGDADCWIDDDSAADRAWSLLAACVGVLDTTYGDFQKLRWN